MANAILFQACRPSHSESPGSSARKVFEDTVFTQRFLPRGEGFTGGDGTYSIELPDGRTVWIFGDTFLGNVTSDNRRIKTTPAYIRNSFVIWEGGKLHTYHQGEPEEFKSMMIPPEIGDPALGYDELEFWYWPGDAFIENGKLNVFASRFFQLDHSDMWGFQFRGTDLVEFSLPDLTPLRIDHFDDLDSIHFGHAVFEGGDYTYIYGLKNKYPYVARAAKGQARGPWEFFNDGQWVNKAEDASPMHDFSGSEQFSIFEWKGVYVLIMQAGGLSREIYSFTAEQPYGPWGNKQMIYETPVPENCKECFTYNAVAHPQFTSDDFVLVSYNTNSMRLQDHYDDALLYRPRFIRVPIEKILRGY